MLLSAVLTQAYILARMRTECKVRSLVANLYRHALSSLSNSRGPACCAQVTTFMLLACYWFELCGGSLLDAHRA